MLSLVHLICRQVRGGSVGSWRRREGSRGRGRRGDEGAKKKCLKTDSNVLSGSRGGRLCVCGGESEQYKEHLKWPI